ncbi:MAG: hypothetical protein E7353_03565 [Clostridiales bacterium]|nr:hypothetical protein [Clostridiales bacterium]
MKEELKAIKRIDVHAHATAFPQFAPPFPSGYRMNNAEEVIAMYDKLNIEKGILLPLGIEGQFQTITSEECAYVASLHPDRFEWFCYVDPRSRGYSTKEDLSKILMHYKKLGAKGVGELMAQMYIDDPYMDNLFYHCAECDMPVTIHIAPKVSGYYGIVDDLGLPRLEKMLKKHKNLKILGHSQLFWAEISGDLTEAERDGYPTGKVKEPGRITQLMREYENLYCDVSANSGMNALMRDPDHAHKFIEEFSDRLLYGCDYTATFNTHTYEMNDFLSEITDNGIMSDENFYKFVRGNAEKLLDIK